MSPAFQSELKKLRQVATREFCVSKALLGQSVQGCKKTYHCCNLVAGHPVWQQHSPRTRLAGEDSTSLKSPQWMLMTIANIWKKEASVEDDQSTGEDLAESITRTTTTLTFWKPPHVERQSVLQLHHEDDYCRRCEQCVRLGHS